MASCRRTRHWLVHNPPICQYRPSPHIDRPPLFNTALGLSSSRRCLSSTTAIMTYALQPTLPPSDTPEDYSRIHFDTSNVPAKRIVGLLACQRDPLLRSYTSKVVAARQAAAPPVAQKGRQKKKTPSASTATSVAGTGANTPTGSLWEIELEDTVVFPEGGGQPWDTGSMVVTDPNGSEHKFIIEGCVRRKLDAVHIVRMPEGAAVAFDDLVGKDVTVHVDWERRMDHMITHTAQHLLSAVLDTRELNTLSWGMDAHPTFDAPYVELPRALTWAEAYEVEAECNARIREARKVWIDVTVQEEGVSDADRANELERESRNLPKDYSGGVIRHCNIDGIDRNACCGTQCPNLGFIQFLHVIPPGTPSGSDKPNQKPTRLWFVAGPRAVGHLSQASRWLSQSAQAIGVARDNIAERLVTIEANRFETADANKSLKGELATLVGEAAAKQRPVAYVHRTEKSTHDYDFMITASVAWAAALDGDTTKDVIIFSSCPLGGTTALIMVQAKDNDRAKKMFDAIKTRLAGDDKARVKGGGAKGRYMAKVEGKWGKADCEAIQAIVDAANAE